MVSTELAVLVLGGGLYLLDCVVFLGRGQGILERGGGRWRLLFGSRHFLIRGSPVVLLNPVTPGALALRTLALFESRAMDSRSPSSVARLLSPLRPLALVQFLLVFVLVPATMVRWPGWLFFVALSLSFLNVALMLTLVASRFRKAGLARRPLWSIGFNAIVCLPLSVNLYRRTALAVGIDGDAARLLRLLPPPARRDARSRLILQLGEAVQDAEEDSALHGRLKCLAERLAMAEANERH